MNKRKLMLLFLFIMGMATLAQAQIKHVTMRVEGMTWNFWAYGVEQHLGRQSGVQKVEVSLVDGKVEVTPKTDGQIDAIQLLKATYDSGVSVAEMSMIATGKIIKDANGQLAFQVSPSQSYVITENEFSHQLADLGGAPTGVTVRGVLYQKQKGQKKQTLPKSLTFTIEEIQKKE